MQPYIQASNKQAFRDLDLVKVDFGTSRSMTQHTYFLKKSRDLEGEVHHHQCLEAKLLRFRRGLQWRQYEEQYLPFGGFITGERWVTLILIILT